MLDSLDKALKPWLRRPRLWLVLALVVALFLAAGAHLGLPLAGQQHDFLPGDDWTDYHFRALDVLHNGLAMPNAPVPYVLPAGFLYIYFLALCYALAGAQPAYVYVIQAGLLGLCVAGLFLAFRKGLSPSARAALLLGLAAFAWLDFLRHYSIRLLSENLFMPLLAGFFLSVRIAWQDGRRWAEPVAFGLLGLMLLTRPNLIIFAPFFLAWVLLASFGLARWRAFALCLLLLMAVVSVMGLRNRAAGGGFVVFTPVSWKMFDIPGYGPKLPGAEKYLGPNQKRAGAWPVARLIVRAFTVDPLGTTAAYARRVLYVAGFLPLAQPRYPYRYRPHWMLLWAALIAVFWLRRRRRMPSDFTLRVLYLYAALSLAMVIGVTWIYSYGFRFIAPVTIPLVAAAAPLVDLIRRRP